MSLGAHTNAPGDYLKSEEKYSRIRGVVRDSSDQLVPFDYKEYIGNSTVAISRKPLPTKGDHKSPTSYGRSIEKVTDDTPFVLMYEDWSHYDRPQGPILQKRTFVESPISMGEGTFTRGPWNLLGPGRDQAEAEADNKCLLKLGSAKAQLGAELAQIRQDVELFSQTAERLARFLLAIKRLQFGSIPKILGLDPRDFKSDRGRTLAELWLMWSYGWKPLFQDCYSLGELVGESISRPDLRIRGSGQGEYENSTSWYSGENSWEMKAKVSVRTVTHAVIANDSIRRINQLGLSNPLSIAWELLPWSFAIDWFMPVGNTLEACTAAYGLHFVKGWRSKQETYLASCKKDKKIRPTVFEPGSYKEEGFSFYRDPIVEFPTPRFYADTTPFSTPRALNALALVRQLHR